MKKIILKVFTLALAFAFTSADGHAQLSQGGTPYTFSNVALSKSTLPAHTLVKPDVNNLFAMDAINDAQGKPYRVGFNIPVNLTTQNSGSWETTANGGKLWRLRIHMDDALALGLYYHNFFIPQGGKVFIYNESENHVIGAFTDEYNFNNQIRATQMIEGSTTTIEYYAPMGTVGIPIIEIKEVAYFYRGVEDFIKPIVDEVTGGNAPSNLEKAASCQIDVACASESAGWSDQIRSVVHYTFTQSGSTFVCSASMVNNTSQDCKPYILTAWHCGERNAGSSISSWVWYWNYKKATCAPGAANGSDPGKGTQTMTGGTVRASSGNGTLNNPPGTNEVAGSDFYLVELASQPPVGYNAYYAGWDRSNTAATSGKGIHHPAGSAKKISTYTSALTNSTYNGGAPNAHWTVIWSATANGHGVTEAGSSGSPIFNQNKRVVGQLSGGSSYCYATSQPDLYGKFYTNWDQCGTSNNARLKPWLDPTNTGVMFIDGSNQPCASTNPPTCGINASATSITVGNTVNFADASTGIPTTWNWNFDLGGLGGVAPATSTSQNPGNVTFSNPGTYQVRLIAANVNGPCTTSVSINVAAAVGCDTLLNILDTNSLTVYTFAAGSYVTGTNTYGDKAKAERYAGYAPYTHITGADVFFSGVVDGGNGSTVTFNIHSETAALPGAVLGSVTYPLSAINGALTSGQGVVFIPFNTAIALGGNPFYVSVDYSNLGTGDALAIVTKFATVATPPNTAYEKWNDNTWSNMATALGQGAWSLYITAHVTNLPVSGSITSTIPTSCTNSPVNFTSTASNATGYTWVLPGATPGNATTANVTATYAVPGTYPVYLVLDGACDGQVIDSTVITITSGFTLTNALTQPTCAGNNGQIIITAAGGTAPYQYSINNGTNYQPSNTFTGLSSGTYSIMVTSANGCSSTSTATLTAPAGGVTMTSTPTNPSCGSTNGSITIAATGGTAPYTYALNGGTAQPSATFTGLAVGSYTIIVTDVNGCTASGTSNLTNTGGPTATTNVTNAVCFGSATGSATVAMTGGTAPFTYLWSNAQTTATATNLNAGTYTVTVTDAGGCQVTATAVITQPSTNLTHTAAVVNSSCGTNNGSITVTVAGGAAPFTYSLNGATGQGSSIFSGLASGTYTVKVTDANGCSSTVSSHTVTGGSSMSASATTVGETCMNANGSVAITGSGGLAPYQYSINNGTNYQSGSSFTGLSAGTYNIMIKDANGCTANTTVGVTNAGGFNLTITGAQTICFGNSATITAGGAGVGGTYAWDNGLGAGSSKNVNPTSTTTYTVIATDASGCTKTGTSVVTVQTQPTVTVTPNTPSVCNGSSVTLTASGAGAYVWNTGATTASVTVTPSSQTTYTVIGQNGSCAGAPVQVTVQVTTAPTVIAGSNVTSIPVGGTVNFNNFGSVASTYSWNFGDGQNSTQGVVSHTYNVAGTYTVVLTGTIGGCTSTTTLTILVGVTSVDQVTLEDNITVYPNPSNGQFTLKIDMNEAQVIDVELYNAIGQIITTKSINHVASSSVNFDVTNQSNGFYFIKVKSKNGTVTKRVSVTK